MSFFNNRGGGVFPGIIEGSATSGLRHRVAVCVERVLDSCIKQNTLEDTKLVLNEVSPANPVPPNRFISAASSQAQACVSDLTITRLTERPEFARVRCRVTIPMRIHFEDSHGTKCTGESGMDTHHDVIMFVPRNSVFPFEVKAIASVNCTSGRAHGENCFIVTACHTVILKITADTDLLIPTYGFCRIPNAVDFTTQECDSFFDLPLFPSGR